MHSDLGEISWSSQSDINGQATIVGKSAIIPLIKVHFVFKHRKQGETEIYLSYLIEK